MITQLKLNVEFRKVRKCIDGQLDKSLGIEALENIAIECNKRAKACFWQDANIITPSEPSYVLLLVTYRDNSCVNQDLELIYFETEGFFKDGVWTISPIPHVTKTFQENDEKMKVMFWRTKTKHPIVSTLGDL